MTSSFVPLQSRPSISKQKTAPGNSCPVCGVNLYVLFIKKCHDWRLYTQNQPRCFEASLPSQLPIAHGLTLGSCYVQIGVCYKLPSSLPVYYSPPCNVPSQCIACYIFGILTSCVHTTGRQLQMLLVNTHHQLPLTLFPWLALAPEGHLLYQQHFRSEHLLSNR